MYIYIYDISSLKVKHTGWQCVDWINMAEDRDVAGYGNETLISSK